MSVSGTSPTDDELMSVRKFAIEIDEDFRKIYNNLNSPSYFLHRFIVLDKNKNRKIKKSAIDYYKTHSDLFDYVSDSRDNILKEIDVNVDSSKSDNFDNLNLELSSSKKIIDLLQQRIDEQSKELSIKNNQIEKLQTLLDQEQRLAVGDREKIKLLEARAEEQEQQNSKKGLFGWLFGKS